MENNQTTTTDAAKRLYGVNKSWRLGTIVEYIVVKETPKTYAVKHNPNERGATVVRKATMEVYDLHFCESYDAAIAYVKQLYEKRIESNNKRIAEMQKDNDALAALLKDLPTVGGDV